MIKLSFVGTVLEHDQEGIISIKLENGIMIKMFHSFPLGEGWVHGSIEFSPNDMNANGVIKGGKLFAKSILETEKPTYKPKYSNASDAPKPKTKLKTGEDRKKVVDVDLDPDDIPTAETTTDSDNKKKILSDDEKAGTNVF